MPTPVEALAWSCVTLGALDETGLLAFVLREVISRNDVSRKDCPPSTTQSDGRLREASEPPPLTSSASAAAAAARGGGGERSTGGGGGDGGDDDDACDESGGDDSGDDDSDDDSDSGGDDDAAADPDDDSHGADGGRWHAALALLEAPRRHLVVRRSPLNNDE